MGIVIATVVSVISILLFLYCVFYAVKKIVLDLKNDNYLLDSKHFSLEVNDSKGLKPTIKRFLTILLICVATRFFIYILGFYAYCSWYGVDHDFSFVMKIFTRSDAPHYIDIANNGYVQYGLNRYWLVFLPLYPWAVRILNFCVNDVYVSSYLLSNVFLGVAAFFLYESVSESLGKKAGKWAVILLLLYPTSFFYAGPYTESLFVMLSILVFYNLQKGRIFAACVFAFFAAFTRNIGVFLAVPIGFEILFMYNPFKNKDWKTFIKKALCLLIIPMGTLIYLFINYKVTGDPLKFLSYEHEYWGQKTAFFFDSVYKFTYYMFNPYVNTKWTLIFPQLAAILFTQIVLVIYAKKMKTSHLVYSLVYFQLTIGLTALLSAPRYLMVLVPIYYVLADTCANNKRAAIIISVVAFLCFIYMTCAFAIGFPIY